MPRIGQGISGSVAAGVPEIETKQHDAHILIHGFNPIADVGVCDKALGARRRESQYMSHICDKFVDNAGTTFIAFIPHD